MNLGLFFKDIPPRRSRGEKYGFLIWNGVDGAQVLLLAKWGVNPRYRNPSFEIVFFGKKYPHTPPIEYQGVWGW